MKHTLNALITAALLASPAIASPETWSGNELGKSGPVAVEKVKDIVGHDAYVTMNGITIRRATPANGANVTAEYGRDARSTLACTADGANIGCTVNRAPVSPAPATVTQKEGEWGGKELGECVEAAAKAIKDDVGQAAFDNIASLEVFLRAQKNNASAAVIIQGTGRRNLHCHTHDTSIDCHVLR